MEPTMKAQRKKWVQSLASLARELKVQAVRDEAKRQAVTAMVERLRKSKAGNMFAIVRRSCRHSGTDLPLE